MKINNSYVTFNSKIDLPIEQLYWRLYSTATDPLGIQWKSDRSLSYDELVEYLQNYKNQRGRRLVAYARLTRRINRKLIQS